jgi:hypothetical protein
MRIDLSSGKDTKNYVGIFIYNLLKAKSTLNRFTSLNLLLLTNYTIILIF